MPVPDFQSLMLPALKAFADEEALLYEIRKRITAAEGLSVGGFRDMLPSGRQTAFGNRVNRAAIHTMNTELLARIN